MKAESGTYVLVLRSSSRSSVPIGRWGELDIKPGYYLYVGSAFGPGGVLSRVSRHCREQKKKHWHIDYLREVTLPIAVWYSHAPVHLEHHWADVLSGMKDITAVTGFGCTDCHCNSHLFYTPKKPDQEEFTRSAHRRISSCRCEQLPGK